MRDIKTLDLPVQISTFGGQISLGTKTGILQINTRTKEGKVLALGMRVVVTSGTSLNLFSTPKDSEGRAILAYEV